MDRRQALTWYRMLETLGDHGVTWDGPAVARAAARTPIRLNEVFPADCGFLFGRMYVGETDIVIGGRPVDPANQAGNWTFDIWVVDPVTDAIIDSCRDLPAGAGDGLCRRVSERAERDVVARLTGSGQSARLRPATYPPRPDTIDARIGDVMDYFKDYLALRPHPAEPGSAATTGFHEVTEFGHPEPGIEIRWRYTFSTPPGSLETTIMQSTVDVVGDPVAWRRGERRRAGNPAYATLPADQSEALAVRRTSYEIAARQALAERQSSRSYRWWVADMGEFIAKVGPRRASRGRGGGGLSATA